MKIDPFAHHQNALQLRALRNEILSSNIANADTPGYKARDIDFKAAFRQVQESPALLKTTRSQHLPNPQSAPAGAEVKYRLPMQPSVDGNTVEADVEQAQFADNTIRYRAQLRFLSGTISGLRYAIKGGE